MKKLWKSNPRLKARPHPMAMASAAKALPWVSLTSITASTKPRAQAVIGTPGQRITSRFRGLSGRKLIRADYGIGADRSQHFGNRFAANMLRPRHGRGLHVEFFDVEVAQLGRRLQAVVDQDAQQPEDVARTVEVDGVLAGERLDGLEVANVPLREAAEDGWGVLGDVQIRLREHRV